MPDLPIGQLAESKTNPRRHFDPVKLAELAASAKEFGILEPLLVRPHHGKGLGYEIVAGARRFRAAKIAELNFLPVRVMELTDEQVLEIQLIENLQREDPHPMEEADGYQRLIAMGHTADDLAEKVGKDRSYIYKRIQLTELLPGAKDAFFENRINIGHALLLCRLPAATQKLAFEEIFESEWKGKKNIHDTKGRAKMSTKELAQFIREEVLLDLSAAPWKKDDAQLLPKAGPCTTCPKHTGANAALFDDFKKGDHCLDADCYNAKRQAFIQVMLKAEPNLPKIAMGYGDQPAGTLPRDKYRVLKNEADKCKYAQAALVIGGDQQVGHKILICCASDCKKHASRDPYGRSQRTEKTPAQQWADRREKLDDKIELEIKQALWREVVASVPEEFNRPEMEFVATRLIDRAGHDGRRALCHTLALEGEKREYGGHDFEAPLVAHMKNLADKDLPGFLVGLSVCDPLTYGDREDLDQMAELYEIDIPTAEKAIREPALAKFNAAKAKALAKAAAAKKPAKAKAAAK